MIMPNDQLMETWLIFLFQVKMYIAKVRKVRFARSMNQHVSSISSINKTLASIHYLEFYPRLLFCLRRIVHCTLHTE